ncbi:hypothetical protein FRC10_008290 [Ceratobasidium sp. 414]|nr:hypothetical protein FRC10_008290 [Ceratobasidium sp. 414]
MTVGVLLSVALLGLGAVCAAPAPGNNSTGCIAKYSGQLKTNQFENSSGNLVFEPYYFNDAGEVAYDPTGTQHPPINAEFQTCSPNYAQEANDGDELYGRFYIPDVKKCLAVTNPSGSPPYFLSAKPCPSDTAGKDSIPFNFIADGSGGDVDIRWLGGTIPSKSVYQGGASACGGQFFVNSTNLQHGYDFDGLGQPNTEKADGYRVHLYCNHPEGKQGGTGFNSFTVPVN